MAGLLPSAEVGWENMENGKSVLHSLSADSLLSPLHRNIIGTSEPTCHPYFTGKETGRLEVTDAELELRGLYSLNGSEEETEN